MRRTRTREQVSGLKLEPSSGDLLRGGEEVELTDTELHAASRERAVIGSVDAARLSPLSRTTEPDAERLRCAGRTEPTRDCCRRGSSEAKRLSDATSTELDEYGWTRTAGRTERNVTERTEAYEYGACTNEPSSSNRTRDAPMQLNREVR